VKSSASPFSGKTYEPTTNNPILYAARFNRLSMIERLLADSRVDASVKDYKPFRSAVKYGHIEAAKLIGRVRGGRGVSLVCIMLR
jgi:hypothetical protein